MASSKQDSASYNMICLLREWDRAPKEKRRQLLQDFIDQHWNCSGPEIESELAQMASLFLARICVWIKLTYMSGTCLTEQLKTLYIFLSASCSHNYLLEFLEHGGMLCLQELCVSPTSREVDKCWAIKVLSCVANAGTRYKEVVCECYGIRAVAECMAKSKSEETQETACALLEILAEGNPRFTDQVYKGLIGVLPCNSPKAQQLALQSIRILQLKRESANRALIDRIICLLESMHLEVQSAVIELIRVLMEFPIADDILTALISLLKPQREIQLGKLFTDALSESDIDIISSDSDEESLQSSEQQNTRRSATLCKQLIAESADHMNKLQLSDPGRNKDKLSKGKTRLRAPCRESALSGTLKSNAKHIKSPKKSNSQLDHQPLPVFVQQASAAKCIRILSQDSSDVTKKLLNMGVLSSLLYAMGNLEYPDSQRQASVALKHFCQAYPSVDEVVREAMGSSLYDEFLANPDTHYLQMTPLQADVLVSNKVTYSGERIDN